MYVGFHLTKAKVFRFPKNEAILEKIALESHKRKGSENRKPFA